MPDELNQGQVSGGETTSDMPADNKPAEVVDGEELSQDTSERTRQQFEKLTQKNKELAEKIRQLEGDPQPQQTSVLDSLRPQSPKTPQNMNVGELNQGEVNQIKQDLFDSQGYVDPALLQSRLDEANRLAKEAQQRASQVEQNYVRFEEDRQLKETYKEFPELDPNNPGFDQKFYNAVRNDLIGQMMSGEKNLLKAASRVSQFYPLKRGEAEAKAIMQKEQKEQIASTGNSGGQASSSANHWKQAEQETLAEATRRGSVDALTERLKRSGY